MEEIRIGTVKRRGNNHVSVIVAGSDEPIRFHADLVFCHRIEAGRCFETEAWHHILRENNSRLAMNDAMTLLSRRAHSEAELKLKLRRKGFPAETVRETLSECRRLNLINDAEFTRIYAQELRDRGLGTLRIRQSLRMKRIDAKLIEQILPAADRQNEESELEAARSAMEKKLRLLKNEKDPRKKKEKLVRHLMARGFPSSIVFRVIRDYTQLG